MPRDHPFLKGHFLEGGVVKNLPSLPTDSSSKKLPTVGGMGLKL